MYDVSASLLIILLLVLILLSGFFSGAETGITALNRYRLRHLARKKHRSALRIKKLMQRPDRLLGVILIGNTFANIFASSIATLLAVRFWGDFGALIATVMLTLTILVFSETAPKTLALMYPEKVAFPTSWVLRGVMVIFYPLVWLITTLSNGFLRCLGIRPKGKTIEPLSCEELRSVVNEARGKMTSSDHEMLLRILDLEQQTVEDAMIPRNEIYSIDMNKPWNEVMTCLIACPYRYAPLCQEHIDNPVGMICIHHVLSLLATSELNKDKLRQIAQVIYFIPNTSPLSQQLAHFQNEHHYIGLVVDEYGDIQGMLTLKDIVEEIVGDFEREDTLFHAQIKEQDDGSVIVDGSMNIRDLNRLKGWHLPTKGPKTLSGLMIEHLEMMPKKAMVIQMADFRMEIVRVSHKTIEQVRIYPQFHRSMSSH